MMPTFSQLLRDTASWSQSEDDLRQTVKQSADEIDRLERVKGHLLEALSECEEYFDNRADADCDQDGFIPNKEMQLLNTVRAAISIPVPSNNQK